MFTNWYDLVTKVRNKQEENAPSNPYADLDLGDETIDAVLTALCSLIDKSGAPTMVLGIMMREYYNELRRREAYDDAKPYSRASRPDVDGVHVDVEGTEPTNMVRGPCSSHGDED